jgi:hypothetical protein
LLGDNLLCCDLQFGYFNRAQFSSLNAFLERLGPFLAAWPKDVQLAVEVRNQGWMAEALGDCLRRHNAVWVLPDQAWMPSPLDVVQRLDAVTGRPGCPVLFHPADFSHAVARTFHAGHVSPT